MAPGEEGKSSDKKYTLLTAGSEWPDKMARGETSGEVPLSLLPASQGTPPASTEAVVNRGSH